MFTVHCCTIRTPINGSIVPRGPWEHALVDGKIAFMSLTRQDVEKVALLARLKLSSDELDTMHQQLDQILGYVEQLSQLDTEGIEPMAHALPMQNVFREDEVTPSLPTSAALLNAPKRVGDFYAVPAVLDAE